MTDTHLPTLLENQEDADSPGEQRPKPQTLPIGSLLGRYRVDAFLGAGGMGEVYRAFDLELERVVAVKVVRELNVPDAEVRFQREARAVSKLNHPHIGAVFDVGRSERRNYLVLEYLEGETLAEVLADRGCLPIDEAVLIGVQIADALSHAHRRGLVHRDLKPSNIMLTPEGAKLLDFGIAKSSTTDTAEPLTSGILGTVAYMSPEQLEGGELDHRTDLFSLGVVLYEALTGRPPFEGSSLPTLIVSVLKEHPSPASTFRREIGPSLDHAIDRCLEKDVSERWQDARDLLGELEWIGERAETGEQAAATPERSPRARTLAALGLAALLLTSFMLGRSVLSDEAPAPLPRQTLSVTLPSKAEGPFQLSPDREHLAYSIGSGFTSRIALRSLVTGADQVLPGTTGGWAPFFSPDGKSLAFFTANHLMRIDLSRRVARQVARIPSGSAGSWSASGVILAERRGGTGGLHLIDLETGETSVLRKVPGSSLRNPRFLPDGRRFVYDQLTRGRSSAVHLATLDALEQESKVLVESASNATFVAKAPGDRRGWLLFSRERSLVAQPFDLDREEVYGDPVAMADDLDPTGPRLLPGYSATETMLLTRSAPKPPPPIRCADRRGPFACGFESSHFFEHVAISPDGKKLAVHRRDLTELWMIDLDSGSNTLVDPRAYFPTWSPDGSQLVYWTVGQKPEVRVRGLASTEKDQLLLSGDVAMYPNDWGVSGHILLTRRLPETGLDVMALDPATGEVEVVLATQSNESRPRFSPDARFFAFESDASGVPEIYVQPFPPTGAQWVISSNGGTRPFWADNGDIFYVSTDDELTAVEVNGDRFQDARTTPLFPAQLTSNRWVNNHSYTTLDGETFYLSTMPKEESLLRAILHWQPDVE